MSQTSMPTVFVPHGGGPCFFMDWNPPDAWDRMGNWLRGVGNLIGTQPRAMVVVSAHWQAAAYTVNTQAAPDLLYDYYGFPEHTYQLRYPAPGAPTLAADVRERLTRAELPTAEDGERGLDHGVFIPFKLIYPQADIPIVQLSLRTGLDPAEHIAVGHALAPLRDDGVLIVGTGMTYHNMQRFQRDGSRFNDDSQTFDAWLGATIAAEPAERERRLINWAQAPCARAAHPEEEHLLPLHVVAGAAADDRGEKVFEDRVLGSVQSAFLFGRDDGQAAA